VVETEETETTEKTATSTERSTTRAAIVPQTTSEHEIKATDMQESAVISDAPTKAANTKTDSVTDLQEKAKLVPEPVLEENEVIRKEESSSDMLRSDMRNSLLSRPICLKRGWTREVCR